MERSLPDYSKIWRVLPILVIVVARAAREIVVGGIKYWRWGDDILLVLGWVVGWLLANIDEGLYVISNPHEVTSQRVKSMFEAKDYKGALALLAATRAERTKTPVRNALTLMLVMVIGVWIVTSNGRPFGSGVVLGLGVRLLSEFMAESDKKKWFWIFARDFSHSEQRWIMLGSIGALIWQVLMTIRG